MTFTFSGQRNVGEDTKNIHPLLTKCLEFQLRAFLKLSNGDAYIKVFKKKNAKNTKTFNFLKQFRGLPEFYTKIMLCGEMKW